MLQMSFLIYIMKNTNDHLTYMSSHNTIDCIHISLISRSSFQERNMFNINPHNS